MILQTKDAQSNATETVVPYRASAWSNAPNTSPETHGAEKMCSRNPTHTATRTLNKTTLHVVQASVWPAVSYHGSSTGEEPSKQRNVRKTIVEMNMQC